jgi:hypothetical protein
MPEMPTESAQPDEKEETYAIFRKTSERVNIGEIGKTIARVKRVPLADATTRLFACNTFIADNLTETQKDEICDLLEKMGVSYFVVKQKDVLQLPGLIIVDSGTFDSSGFACTACGETTTYTWENILLVNAARFETVSRKVITNHDQRSGAWVMTLPGTGIQGIPVRLRGKKRPPEIVKEITHRLAMDIFVKEPSSRFRLLQQTNPYEPPDERAAAPELERFRKLAQDILAFARDAFVGDAVNTLAENRDLSEFTYQAKHKFDLVNFYLLNLAQHPKQTNR